MNKFFQKHKTPIIAGGLISLGLAIVLVLLGTIIIDPGDAPLSGLVIINLLGFMICWSFISFLTYKFSPYKILVLACIFSAANIIDHLMKTPGNQITISLIILFWIGVVYLFFPHFINKYKVAILSVYGVVILYFLFFNFIPNDSEGSHQSFNNYLIIPIPIFLSLWLYEQWRWVKTIKADKAKAELDLLKSQINPHFFFNTLNNLYGLAVEKSDQAPAMILKLSDIMRHTIYNGKEDYVPLDQEVAYLEDYIELHKIRYHRKVDITLDKDLNHLHNIAPLLLILPVENAFKHGVDSLAENAFIKIKISTSSTKIYFQISNNYENNLDKPEGIGLNNLKKRLDLIYPNRHHININKTGADYTLTLEIEVDEISNN